MTLFTNTFSAGPRTCVLLGAIVVLLVLNLPAWAQPQQPDGQAPQSREEGAKASGSGSSPTSAEAAELLLLIQELQQRLANLEATTGNTSAPPPGTPAANTTTVAPATAPGVAPPARQADEPKEFGSYTPNLGFKLANTEYGDINLSIYTYVRYLNQLGLDPTYTDFFGNVKTVQQRHDVQIQKLQMKFLGWVLDPKFRYFLYAWTSNANQGRGAQVVLAGNLGYTFNKYVTFAGGIRSLPGTRSVEGNFPFWFGVDSRMIADEFFRPSYTSGIWVTGNITDRLNYQAMIGNNMSTLGVSAAQLDNGLNTFSSSLVWQPTGEFSEGFSGQGWGDFEDHEKFSTRLGAHFSRSTENKESQPNSDTFENTQLRLSDGSIIFTPNLFGQGIEITDADWKMISLDGGFKYQGYSLEGEYYFRRLDNFKGPGTEVLPSVSDHGFQLQGSMMVVPQKLQAYIGHSRIFDQFGNPWDFRVGLNWFPFKNHVVRWNFEGLQLSESPVGYTSVPFAVGGNGFVFHTSMELAF